MGTGEYNSGGGGSNPAIDKYPVQRAKKKSSRKAPSRFMLRNGNEHRPLGSYADLCLEQGSSRTNRSQEKKRDESVMAAYDKKKMGQLESTH